MKKTVIVLLGLLLTGIPLFAKGASQAGSSGAGSSGAVKIGVSIPSADHGWTGGIGWWANHAVDQIKADNPGKFDFRVVLADNPSSQVRNVEDMMVWGMQYLVILPYESAPLTPIVKEAQSKGVRVIVVDRGLTDASFGYVNLAGDNAAMGRLSGQWIAKEMKAAGLTNYVAMGGMPVVIDGERMKAFFSEMDKEPSLVNLLGQDKYEFSNWSTQEGLKLMETFLQQYPQIDAVFCQDDDVLTGVLQAIKESGRTDVKIAFGGAGSKAVYQMIKNGDPLVRATSLYHPSMIADGIQYAADIALGKKDASFQTAKAPVTVVVPSALIDKSNVDQYYQADSPF